MQFLLAQQPSYAASEMDTCPLYLLVVLFVGGFICWLIIKSHFLRKLECVQQSTFWAVCRAPWPLELFHEWVGIAPCRTFAHLPISCGSPSHLRRHPSLCLLFRTKGLWSNGLVTRARRLVFMFFLHSAPQFGLSSFVVPFDKCSPATPLILTHFLASLLPVTTLELLLSTHPLPRLLSLSKCFDYAALL